MKLPSSYPSIDSTMLHPCLQTLPLPTIIHWGAWKQTYLMAAQEARETVRLFSFAFLHCQTFTLFYFDSWVRWEYNWYQLLPIRNRGVAYIVLLLLYWSLIVCVVFRRKPCRSKGKVGGINKNGSISFCCATGSQNLHPGVDPKCVLISGLF